MTVLEMGVKQRKIFRVGERDYSLAFTVPIVAELEVTLGRSMKSAADWLRIQTKEVRGILEAGLKHYHPDEAANVAEAVSLALDPEEIEVVIDGLCVAACPKAMARLEAELEKARARAKRGLSPLPNVPGVDAL